MSINTTGYVSLQRSIMNSDIYPLQKKRPFTRSEAWIDMILLAEYEDNGVLKRGQFNHSNRYLGKRWKWDKMKVYRFFKKLQKEQRIAIRIDTPTDTPSDTASDTAIDTPQTIVSILKYNNLQGLRKKSDTASDTQPDTLPDTQSDTNNNVNKINNRKINKYSIPFLKVWQLYPNKNGRKKAEEKYRAALKKTDHQTILTAVTNQIRYNWKETDSKYIPMFKTWLHGEQWDDPIQKVQGSEKPKEEKIKTFICDGCTKELKQINEPSIYERFCECGGEFLPEYIHNINKRRKEPPKPVGVDQETKNVNEMLANLLEGKVIQ